MQMADCGRGYYVPMYRTFNKQKYRLSSLNPPLGSLSKSDAKKLAKDARKAGWAIRVVKVDVPVYLKGVYPPRVNLDDGYLLYERKSLKTAPKAVGKRMISADIGLKPWRL